MATRERPRLVTEWSKRLKSEKAKRAAKRFDLVLASLDLDAGLARSLKMRRAKGRVELVSRVSTFGTRVFPPAAKVVNLARAKRMDFEDKAGFRPKHLDFRPFPQG